MNKVFNLLQQQGVTCTREPSKLLNLPWVLMSQDPLIVQLREALKECDDFNNGANFRVLKAYERWQH